MLTPPQDPVIRAQGLRKVYGAFTAVDGIDFAIPAGCCFGFLGPNGAGKTTTLRMLLGLTPMSAGDLTVLGHRLPGAAIRARERIGVVPQDDNLDPDFSIEQNLLVHASYFGIPAQQARPVVEQLLDFAQLSERRTQQTDTLSGGMKRRLAIARALVNTPDLVVLDEPTTGLDPQVRHVIWERLNQLKRAGRTLLLTTHYMEEAERLCDELVIMDHGRILARGRPDELIAEHVEAEVIELRGVDDALFDIHRLDTLDNARVERLGSSAYCYTDDARALFPTLEAIDGVRLIHRVTGLEDVFLRLTGRELRE